MPSSVAAVFCEVPVRYRPNAASGGWRYGRDLARAARADVDSPIEVWHLCCALRNVL